MCIQVIWFTLFFLKCTLGLGFGSLDNQTKNLCLYYTVYSKNYTVYYTDHSLEQWEGKDKREKIIQNFYFNCKEFGVKNFIYTKLLFRLCQLCLSNKLTKNGTYITAYTVHTTLCTIQTRAQYAWNKPKERTYGRNALVTN